jgi:hypothetical protein
MQGTWSQGQLQISHDLPRQLNADIITVSRYYPALLFDVNEAMGRLLLLLRMPLILKMLS